MTPAEVIQAKLMLRLDERATSPRKVVDIHDVANRIDSDRQSHRLTVLHRLNIMRDEPGSVAFEETHEDCREAENTGANILRVGVILNVTFADQLGPLER